MHKRSWRPEKAAADLLLSNILQSWPEARRDYFLSVFSSLASSSSYPFHREIPTTPNLPFERTRVNRPPPLEDSVLSFKVSNRSIRDVRNSTLGVMFAAFCSLSTLQSICPWSELFKHILLLTLRLIPTVPNESSCSSSPTASTNSMASPHGHSTRINSFSNAV